MRVWKEGPPACTTKCNLLLDQWRHIDGVWMIRSRIFTVTGCRSVKRNIFQSYLMPVSWCTRLSAYAPFPAARGLCGSGTTCGTILTSGTRETVSGSWRSTPPRSPNARGMGVRYHHGALGTGIMSPTNSGLEMYAGSGGQHYNTDSR